MRDLLKLQSYTSKEDSPKVDIFKQLLLLSAGWSAITLLIMGLDMRNTWVNSLETGRLQARMALEKDGQYIAWASQLNADLDQGHSSADQQQPSATNMTTADAPSRQAADHHSIISRIHQFSEKDPVLSSRLTSLRAVHPAKSPDDWELNGLRQFALGKKEISTLEEIGGQSYMRVMQPLNAKSSCLVCHEDYSLNDTLGGLSIRVPIAEIQQLRKKTLLTDYLLYLGVWLIGLFGLALGSRRLKHQLDTQIGIETALHDFKLSLDNINEAVLMFETDNLELFYSNTGATILLGASVEELNGTPLPDFVINNERLDFYAKLEPLYRRTSESFTAETTFLSATGQTIDVEIHVAYVIPREGADRFLVVVRDISERKIAEREKSEMQTQLLHAQKLESVGQLAAGIAHEINTPVQFVSSNVDFFGESFDDVSEALKDLQSLDDTHITSESVDKILDKLDWGYLADELPTAIQQSKEGLEQISSIIQALNAFSHPSGKTKIPENLNEIVELTTTISRNEWKYAAHLTLDLDPDLPPVPCIKDELGQVLLNLLINAAHAILSKHSDERDVSQEEKITIITSVTGDFAEIRVTDSGPGIPETIQNRVFDPFFTTKEVGKGSGQGLAICRDVIEKKHHGTLSFTTEINIGTTFYIRLPLVDIQSIEDMTTN